MQVIDQVRVSVRGLMRSLARNLDKLAGGRLSPNMVTIVSTLLHLVIAYFIVHGNLAVAGALLIVFGLMDALDGELARLQGSGNDFGVLLDATADRLKEVILYGAIAFKFAGNGQPRLVLISLLAVGFSLCVTFVKAKGEAIVTVTHGKKLSPGELNRAFGQDSLMRFEVRMAVLVIGLLANLLAAAVLLITVFSLFSLAGRLIELKRQLA